MVAKPVLMAQKVFLPCIWMDWKETIYYDLLPYGQTDFCCCQQLNGLKLDIAQKRSELANRRVFVLNQDNNRPHFFIITGQKLR
ncbi:hypothetical protein TNCV_3326461 [Trichonephila clavipes]|nr:hypothetical protein TNCV_3326461 [Trichonephila clavipes]